MKKWTALMMTVIMVCAMGISGCGSTGDASADTTSAAETGAADETAAESTQASAETETEAGTEAETQAAIPPAENPDFSMGLDEEGNLEDKSVTDLVTLPDYKNAVFSKAEVDVSDEEVQEKIKSITASYSTTEQVKDREVKDGDTVNIDYVGSIDGVEFEGGNTNGNGTDVTIGVTSYIDDFLEQLIGHKPGETFDVNVTFPDEYPQNTDLQGKDAVFVTTINYISETVEPEINDEFVEKNLKESFGYESVEDMNTKIRADLAKNKAYSVVWKWLLDKSEFSELPEALVTGHLDIYEAYMNKTAYNYGMTLADYLQAAGIGSVEEMREGYRQNAEQTTKQYIITQAISDKENITVSEDELKEFFGEEQFQTYLDFYGAGYIKFNLKMSKVSEVIMETATLTETEEETTAAGEETKAAEEDVTAAAEETAVPAEETAAAEETAEPAEETETAEETAAAEETEAPAETEAETTAAQ